MVNTYTIEYEEQEGIYRCHCGTSWIVEFEKTAPEAIAKIHNEAHALWEKQSFERNRQFANMMFGLPEDTQWAKEESK